MPAPSRVASRVLAAAALLAASGACALVFPAAASAAKSQATTPLSLYSAYSWKNPYNPSWCMSEDDIHQREWIGSLNGSFTTTEQLCGTSADYYIGFYWTAGGIGLQADADVVGGSASVTITSPSGDSHEAVLVGSTTSKGTTTYHYQACYVPAYSVSSDTGGAPLPGGTWSITLSGAIKKAYYFVNAQMTDATFQQQHCPASEQNLAP
jgi:hypothetical protein